MSERIHALAQLLPGKNSINDCSLEELQHLAKRYPFFAPAQFLVLQKMKQEHLPGLEKQQQKAVLYYHDPLLFELFLSEEKFYTATDSLPATTLVEEVILPQPEVETVKSDEAQTETTVTEYTPALLAVLPENESGETAGWNEVQDSDEEQSAAHTTEEDLTPEAEITQDVQDAPESMQNVPLLQNEPISEVPVNKETAPGVISAQPVKVATVSQKEEALFEPFYTVDYFASQGIKITADELPKDKLSKQVRSFTEWLKVMKRLPAADIAQKPKSTAEQTVEHLASHSVEGGEVVTEAMAEVWAKQGANEKAVETYNKLSLLNPSKKAYFAAKIENLKGS